MILRWCLRLLDWRHCAWRRCDPFRERGSCFFDCPPSILYELDYGRLVDGLPLNQLNRVELIRIGGPSQWELRRTKLFDFTRDSSNCLPADFIPNWTGVLVVASNDDRI